MEITYATNKMEKQCASEGKMRAKWGDRAKKLMQRLGELSGIKTLDGIRKYPPANCHELTGDKAGQLAVDISHNFRLIFEPGNDPIPRKDDGGLDWTKVTQIVIIEVTDYH